MTSFTPPPKTRAKQPKLKRVMYLPSKTARRIEYLAVSTGTSTTQVMSELLNAALRVKGIKVPDDEEGA